MSATTRDAGRVCLKTRSDECRFSWPDILPEPTIGGYDLGHDLGLDVIQMEHGLRTRQIFDHQPLTIQVEMNLNNLQMATLFAFAKQAGAGEFEIDLFNPADSNPGKSRMSAQIVSSISTSDILRGFRRVSFTLYVRSPVIAETSEFDAF